MAKVENIPVELKVGVRELRDNLTGFLQEVREGKSILVTSHNVIVAEIHPPSKPSPRQPGALRGQITMAEDFDTLPPDLLDVMEA